MQANGQAVVGHEHLADTIDQVPHASGGHQGAHDPKPSLSGTEHQNAQDEQMKTEDDQRQVPSGLKGTEQYHHLSLHLICSEGLQKICSSDNLQSTQEI